MKLSQHILLFNQEVKRFFNHFDGETLIAVTTTTGLIHNLDATRVESGIMVELTTLNVE